MVLGVFCEGAFMLTDAKLRNLKPRDKMYKVVDRDGLYVAVSKAGTVSFRFKWQPRNADC